MKNLIFLLGLLLASAVLFNYAPPKPSPELLPLISGLVFAGIVARFVFSNVLGLVYDKKSKTHYPLRLWIGHVIAALIAIVAFSVLIPFFAFLMTSSLLKNSLAFLSFALPMLSLIVYSILALFISKRERYSAEPAWGPGGNSLGWYSIKWASKKAGWFIGLTSWLLILTALIIAYCPI